MTAIAVLVLVAGMAGVVILTKQHNSPGAVMNKVAADLDNWPGIRSRFTAPAGGGFDITIDRDGNSTATMDITGIAGTQGLPDISGSRIDNAKIGNNWMTRKDGGPWMRSPTPSSNPDTEPGSGDPQWLANRMRGMTWIGEPGRMLDRQ